MQTGGHTAPQADCLGCCVQSLAQWEPSSGPGDGLGPGEGGQVGRQLGIPVTGTGFKAMERENGKEKGIGRKGRETIEKKRRKRRDKIKIIDRRKRLEGRDQLSEAKSEQ